MLTKFGSLFFKKKKIQIPQTFELKDTNAAILAADGFQEDELFAPKAALEAAGCSTHIVSLKRGRIRSWKENNWGKSARVDLSVDEALNMEFDFLVLPGGVMAPDKLRASLQAVNFVKTFMLSNRPIAAICHGVQTLIETDLLEGRKLTSWPSLKTDLLNAGANWTNKQVVVDHKLITSRQPSDLPAFIQEMKRIFVSGKIQHAIPNTESFVSIR